MGLSCKARALGPACRTPSKKRTSRNHLPGMVFAGLASGHTDMRMLYLAYERQAGLLELTRTAARSLLTALSPWDKLTGHPLRYAAAAGALMARAGLTHHRPAYGIGTVVVGNRDVPVTEEAISATAFG